MSDGKNTEQVQSFFIKLITSANTYIGFGGGLVVGVIGGILLAKIL